MAIVLMWVGALGGGAALVIGSALKLDFLAAMGTVMLIIAIAYGIAMSIKESMEDDV